MTSVLLMTVGAALYFGSKQIAALFRTDEKVKRAVDDVVLTTLDLNPGSPLTRDERARAERERLIEFDGAFFKIIGVVIFNIGVLVLLI